MEKQPKLREIHIRLSDKDWRKLATLAKKEHRSITAQVCWIVSIALAEQ